DFPRAFSFPYLSRRGQVRVCFGKLLAILTPRSVTLVACSPVPPRALYVASLGCCIPRPARLDRFGPCRLLP
ncbi:unnamed protein product, partial [Ascophyllum nodosum]